MAHHQRGENNGQKNDSASRRLDAKLKSIVP